MATEKIDQTPLERIKDNIKASYEYDKDNYDRFHFFMSFLFNTTLTESDKSTLADLQKPIIECNVLEAFLSRLWGEFATNEPSILVTKKPNSKVDPATINFVEGYYRYLLHTANKDQFQLLTYRDSMGGGFSAMEVIADYEDEHSFEQQLKLVKPDDVTLVGYDPLARKPSKWDGRYLFKLYPKTEDEFKKEYANVELKNITWSRSMQGFNFSYQNENTKILLIADYYEKKVENKKLLSLSNGKTITDDKYKKLLKKWDEGVQKGLTMRQPPIVVKERQTDITTIVRYRIIETQILEYVETEFSQFPIAFVDGNSAMLKKNDKSSVKQMTRPYIYQAYDVQRAKNVAFQSLMNEIEDTMRSKWKAPLEGIPAEEDYQNAYTNNQIPNILLYRAFKDKEGNIPLPPPQEIMRTPIPPEITQTISLCDQTIQMILGTYDAAQGNPDDNLSGKAIIEGATQSNAAAKPYIINNLQALNHIAQVVLDWLPKHVKTPRTMPVIGKDGKPSYVVVNQKPTPGQPPGIQLNYKPGELNICVEAGVNFEVQKNRSLQQLFAAMNASPAVSAFMGKYGVPTIVDNMAVRGQEQLKIYADQWQKQQLQPAPPNPEIALKQQELALKGQQMQMENQHHQDDMVLGLQKVANEKQQTQNDSDKIALEAEQARTDDLVDVGRSQAENKRTAADVALKVHDQLHRHHKEAVELAHTIHQDNKPEINKND